MCNFLEYKGRSDSPLAWSPTRLSTPPKTLLCLRDLTCISLCTLADYFVNTDTKVVYRRYASLFFIAATDNTDNELITLEIVHRYVEQMDKYYGNVCELDIIFNFQKAYFILDELLIAGEMQETSKKNVLRVIGAQDSLEDMEVSFGFVCPATNIHFWEHGDSHFTLLMHHPLIPLPHIGRG